MSIQRSPASTTGGMNGTWVLVGLWVGVDVGVAVGVAVGVDVGVLVGVEVGVDVGVLVGVWVGVGVFVDVGVKLGLLKSSILIGAAWSSARTNPEGIISNPSSNAAISTRPTMVHSQTGRWVSVVMGGLICGVGALFTPLISRVASASTPGVVAFIRSRDHFNAALTRGSSESSP